MPTSSYAGIRTPTLGSFGRNHSWYDRMNRVDGPTQIHAEGEVPVLPGRLVGRADEIHAGVAAENRNGPELPLDAVRGGGPGLAIGHVELDGERRSALFLQRG